MNGHLPVSKGGSNYLVALSIGENMAIVHESNAASILNKATIDWNGNGLIGTAILGATMFSEPTDDTTNFINAGQGVLFTNIDSTKVYSYKNGDTFDCFLFLMLPTTKPANLSWGLYASIYAVYLNWQGIGENERSILCLPVDTTSITNIKTHLVEISKNSVSSQNSLIPVATQPSNLTQNTIGTFSGMYLNADSYTINTEDTLAEFNGVTTNVTKDFSSSANTVIAYKDFASFYDDYPQDRQYIIASTFTCKWR